MKRRGMIMGLAAVLAVVSLAAWQQESASKNSQAWEYCTVRGGGVGDREPGPGHSPGTREYYAIAEVCFAEQGGCRSRNMEYTFLATKEQFLQMSPELPRPAIVKALAVLGAEGWELVGFGPDMNLWSLEQAHLCLYLKRKKP